jgi:peroxiredoxin Q/BCP
MTNMRILLSAILVLALSGPAFGAPAVGDQAPDFKLPGSDGKSHTLADFKGKQAVIISFFPKAFTGG